MPFRVFGRKRKKDNGAKLVEMGPEPEDEHGPRVPPGQPVPYEATSWSPPSGEGGLYQSGSAVVAQRGPDPFKQVVHSEVMDKTHVVTVPETVASTPDAGVEDGVGGMPPSQGLAPEVKEAVEPEVDYSMTLQCPECKTAMRVPRRRPIKVTCPSCKAVGILR